MLPYSRIIQPNKVKRWRGCVVEIYEAANELIAYRLEDDSIEIHDIG